MTKRLNTLLLLGLFLGTGVHAQFIFEDEEGLTEATDFPLRSGENIRLFADRNMYAVSEEVYLSALYVPPAEAVGLEWSKIMYFELIKWDGTRLSASKGEIKDGMAAGKVRIPANLLSGNYYLRAYTKWMRNFSPYHYEYLPVKIVNPSTGQIDPGPEENSLLKKKNESSNRSGLDVSVGGMKKKYGRREPVKFDLLSEEHEGVYLVKVAKIANDEKGSYSFEDDSNPGRISYLPEVNGLTLSGRVVQKDSDLAVVNSLIQLSTFPNSSVFSEMETDQNGEFFFTLPHDFCSGELHISEEDTYDGSHDIRIVSEYCSKPVLLPYLPFELSEEERKIVKEIVINAQINERFSLQGDPDSCIAVPFYGTPGSVTYVSDYIELHDLREFFFELIQHVSIRIENGKPRLVVFGQSSLDRFPPLILMDNIPVPNDETLLGLPGRKIERIEVVNHGYVVGSRKYSGIISIYSKDRDMAGLKLQNSHFFNYGIPSDQALPGGKTMDMNKPDRRNLLYWDPHLKIAAGSKSEIEFLTSDATGEYVLTIIEIGLKGELKSSGLVFEVE